MDLATAQPSISVPADPVKAELDHATRPAIITRVNTVHIQRFGRASYISWTVMPGFQGLGFAFFSFFISPPQLSFSLSQKLRYSMMTTVTKRTIRIIPTLL